MTNDKTAIPPKDLRRWGSLPEQFHQIRASNALTREQLAGLLAGYFPQLASMGRRDEFGSPMFKESWAGSAIQTVVAAGLLDSMANHMFQPRRTVTRGEFAVAIGRVTRMLGCLQRLLLRLARQTWFLAVPYTWNSSLSWFMG